ncbi:MAG: hypothetical protein H7061_14485 [Bdellovibrionaceae bacterium]|nr:hypothetical protein [Bdellovibrio sp.]
MNIPKLRSYIAIVTFLFVQVGLAQSLIGIDAAASNQSSVQIPNAKGYRNSNGILVPGMAFNAPIEPIKETVVSDGLTNYAHNYVHSKNVLMPITIQETAAALQIDEAKSDPRAIDILRYALNQEAQNEHAQNQRAGWFKSANQRLVPESATFFLATGLVVFETAYMKFHGDPLAMEKHILSLKDPIATASFYAFMQANGFYMHQASKGLPRGIDPHTRAQMMRRFSYGGMVWGSLASSLLSDIFAPFKPCLEKMFTKDYRFTKDLQEKCENDLNSAWAQWTVRGKFGQYAPQILSLVLSQKAAELGTALASGAFKSVTHKLNGFEAVGSATNSKAIKRLIYKLTGVDALFMLVPGRPPIILFRWVMKATQMTVFMAIDHQISAPIYRAFNNVYKPTAFHFDAVKIDRLWNLADHYGWEDHRTMSDQIQCPVQIPDCKKFSDLAGEIQNFSAQTQQWREHINAVNEQDLAGWMEMSKKILNQVALTYDFYKTYVNNLSDTLMVGNLIQKGEAEPKAIMSYSRYPYRELPLYGVKFKDGTESKKVPAKDQYLISPQHMEQFQIQHIHEIAEAATSDSYHVLQILKLPRNVQDSWQNILEALSSNDLNKIARGLIMMNAISGFYGLDVQKKAGFLNEPKYTEVMKSLRGTLGDPQPIMYAGAALSQAFASYGPGLQTAREANFRWSGKTYSFNKDGDFLTYQMLCGKSEGSLTNNWIFSDDFLPPRIVNEGSKPIQLCNNAGTFVSSGNIYSMPLKNAKTGKVFKNITEYITEHLDYQNIMGDYRDFTSKSTFDSWWINTVKEKVRPRFADFDERFKVLAKKNQDVLIGTNLPNVDKAVDKIFNWGQYLPVSIMASFRWELEVYLDLLQSVATKKKPIADGEEISFMKLISQNAQANKTATDALGSRVYGKRIDELQELNKLFNKYFILLPANEITFEQYGEVSAAIKKQIELINERLGLDEKVYIQNSHPDIGEIEEIAHAERTVKFLSGSFEKLKDPTILNSKTEIKKIDLSLSPTKHKVALATIKGLNLLESEIRRFLRMKLLLSQRLDIDIKEYMIDLRDTDNSQKGLSGPRSAATLRGGK